jgi:hypothetical protein
MIMIVYNKDELDDVRRIMITLERQMPVTIGKITVACVEE